MSKSRKEPDKISVANNRRARHHYEVLETFEAGMSLLGPEVKSLRSGDLKIEGSFARIEDGQVKLYNLYIAPYQNNTSEDIPPDRTRKLLMHKREIRKLQARWENKGLTLVPLEIYFLHGWAKVRLALAKGRRGPDKRRELRRKDAARELQKSFKGRFKV